MRKKLFTLTCALLLITKVFCLSLLAAPLQTNEPVGAQISFRDEYLSVKEDAGFVHVTMRLQNPAAASADLVLQKAPYGTIEATDINFTRKTMQFTDKSSSTRTISIPIRNDKLKEMDEYFVLSLENLKGIALQGKPSITIYIRDNDRTAPKATQEIELNYVSSFKPQVTEGSTTEIVVHDPVSQRLFMTSAVQGRLDIADFSNPAAIKLITSVDMKPYGGITSVAVRNGVVAVASPNADEQQNGSVVFFDVNGVFQKQVKVGALPDMITFTPDGKQILTANEGQPNTDYTIDPEGSISVIDMAGGLTAVNQSKVTTLLFTGFNAREASLIASGVRKTKASSTLSQDFEPEYITISPDSKKAWATLQENNATAEIDLENKQIKAVWAFGTKDFSSPNNGFDASDKTSEIHLANYPVKSFFLADGIANFKAKNRTYLVTANEGDEKEYDGLNERTTVGDVVLDQNKFPNAAELQQNYNLGRLRITNLQGDTDQDGDFDELYMVGARSFSIWDAATKTLVYDSKNDFEFITATDPKVAPIFNADNEDNEFKGRSRSKGPEPEGITVATIKDKTYAFITLERIGGVMVYDVTDPNEVKFVDYNNNRSLTEFAGDHGPEGIIYIDGQDSPDKNSYLAVANEISGSVSLYQIKENTPPRTFAAFSPQKGLPGTIVRITDKGLLTTKSVQFNGVEAPFTIVSDTEVKAVVPAKATTGLITLETAGTKLISPKNFTVQQPTISFFIPEYGVEGSKVLLLGDHLASTREVRFNGIPTKDFQVYFGSLIMATVPAGATTGKIGVLLAGGGSAISEKDFVIVPAMPAPTARKATDKLAEKSETLNELANTPLPTIAYPNPFQDAVTITVQLQKPEQVKLAIYSNTGQLIKVLDTGLMEKGSHQLTWDGTDNRGNAVKPGLYIYQVQQQNGITGKGKIIKASAGE